MTLDAEAGRRGLPPKNEMRSGPATRTAFAMRKSQSARLRFALRARDQPFETPFPASLPSCSALRRSFAPEGAFRSPSCRPVAVPHMRDRFLRRPQRPGRPQRLHALGTAQQSSHPPLALKSENFPANRSSGKLLQNQSCPIPGGVKFTPAVRAMSRIRRFSAIGNRGSAVRKLWTQGLPCGKGWKTQD